MTTTELRAAYERASRRVQDAADAIQAAGPRDDLAALEAELDEAIDDGERCRGNLRRRSGTTRHGPRSARMAVPTR